MAQQIDVNDPKFAAWNNYLEEHKDDYPEEEEKVRRRKISIDYQLNKFYDKYTNIAPLIRDDKWNIYVRQYYHHQSLSSQFPQLRILNIAKAYHKVNSQTFAYKMKQLDLPAEFL